MDDNKKKRVVSALKLIGKVLFGVLSVPFLFLFGFIGFVAHGASTNLIYWLIFAGWIAAYYFLYIK